MKSLKQTSYVSLILATTLLSACGSSGVTANPSTSQGQQNGEVVPPVVTSSGTGAYPLSFQTVGTNGLTTSAPLRTDTLLQVAVTVNPASQNQYPAGSGLYSNYTANYTCATIAVSLQMEQNGTYVTLATVVTNRLTAAGTPGCAGSVASQTIDFSPYMTPGHGNVKIQAQAITSNVNCIQSTTYPYNYPYQYAAVCASNPMQSIYQYHVVNGSLQVEVDGTSFN